jgi:NADH:ubiquinone oxidoreductase subunit F (NADH-binding)
VTLLSENTELIEKKKEFCLFLKDKRAFKCIVCKYGKKRERENMDCYTKKNRKKQNKDKEECADFFFFLENIKRVSFW